MSGYSSSLNQGYNEDPGINWGRVAGYAAGGVMALGLMRMGVARTLGTARAQRGVSRIKGLAKSTAQDLKRGWTGTGSDTGAKVIDDGLGWMRRQEARDVLPTNLYSNGGTPTIPKRSGRRGASYGSQIYGKYSNTGNPVSHRIPQVNSMRNIYGTSPSQVTEMMRQPTFQALGHTPQKVRRQIGAPGRALGLY